jgi:hypothetical protein
MSSDLQKLPQLCIKNCGFFGFEFFIVKLISKFSNPKNGGMCSVCFKLNQEKLSKDILPISLKEAKEINVCSDEPIIEKNIEVLGLSI